MNDIITTSLMESLAQVFKEIKSPGSSVGRARDYKGSLVS